MSGHFGKQEGARIAQCLKLKFSLTSSENFPLSLMSYDFTCLGTTSTSPAQLIPARDTWETISFNRMTHICISNLTIIGSDNVLLPGQHHTIIWTNAGILLIGPLGTNFSEILIRIHKFSFMKMHLKMSSAKWRPFCQCVKHSHSDGYQATRHINQIWCAE